MSLTIDTGRLRQAIEQCGNPDALAEAADGLSAVGSGIATTGGQLVTRWQGLESCYFAPETPQLVHAIQPVQTRTDWVGGTISPVSAALSTFAGQLGALKPKLEALLEEANSFNAYAAAHPDWAGSGTSPSKGAFELGKTPDAAEHGAAQTRHDRIVREIETTCGELAAHEVQCAQEIMKHVDSKVIGDPGGSRPKPGAQPWEVQLLQGKHPFGDLWIDKGPFLDRMGIGFVKSLMDGIAGLSSLVGLGFSFDPVTGEVHSNFGWHTVEAAWGGMGKLALATSLTGLFGGLGLAAMGHPWLLRQNVKMYEGMWNGFTGNGLPGGWAVRSGYILGNVTQAAAPGPGKLMIGALAEREGILGGLARAAESGAKGRWILPEGWLSDFRTFGKTPDFLAGLGSHRVTGFAGRLSDRIGELGAFLHDRTPLGDLTAQIHDLRGNPLHDVALDHHGEPTHAPIYSPTGPHLAAKDGIDFRPHEGLRAFEHAMETGKWKEFLNDGPHATYNDIARDHVGVRLIHDGGRVQAEIFYHYQLRGRGVDTVFGVIRDGKIMRYETPQSFFSDTGALAADLPVPKEVRELYGSEGRRAAWEGVPFHNLREGAAQYNDYLERQDEARHEHEKAEGHGA